MSLNFSFTDRESIQQITSRILLEVGAVNFNATTPYIFTSGWASPVYIDCRRLIFYPRVRETLCTFATSIILRDIGFEAIDVVAGGETAGIPFAAWIADRLALPMQYVRKKPKGFGRGNQIEGDIRENARTLLVEDLTTDGRSKVNFCKALRQAGVIVEHTFVFFYYGIFPESERIMSDIGVRLHWLANWWDVLKVAKAENRFDTATLREVEKFLNDPVGWSGAHGGVSELPAG